MIQIFGTKKCKDTQKAIRFFKERGVIFQFIDLNEKSFSKGELKSINNSISYEELIDKNSKRYKEMQLEYIEYDPEELLLNNPDIIKTPVIRSGNRAYNGFDQKELQKFL